MGSAVEKIVDARTLFAYDRSGSTGGVALYHDISQRIIRSLPADTIIAYWDSEHGVIPRASLDDINARRRGFGGTDATQIVRAVIASNFRGHLVILTDGEVSGVDECDRLIRAGGLHWSRVSVHVVSTRPNVSVSAPFTRACPHEVRQYTRDDAEGTRVAAVAAEDLAAVAALDAIATQAEFDAALPSLRAAITAATMGTAGDPVLRDRLLAMRERIVRHKAAQAAALAVAPGGAAAPAPTFLGTIAAGDFAGAEAEMRRMHAAYYGAGVAVTLGFEGAVSQLVDMCRGGLRSAFDLGAIAAQRAGRSDVAVAAAAPATVLEEAATEAAAAACPALTCPVLLEGGGDMLLLVRAPAPAQPLLSLLDARGANECIDNPLNALRHPALVAAIAAALDSHVSLAAYKAAAAAGAPIVTSPLTRAPLCGALALGPHPAHAAASDWTLATLLAGGKLLGNVDLWYAVVWFIVAGPSAYCGAAPAGAAAAAAGAGGGGGDASAVDGMSLADDADEAAAAAAAGGDAAAAAAAAATAAAASPGLERLQPLQPLLEEHLRWRLAHRTTFAALSGLSQFLCTRVPLGAAAWYVLHAALLRPSPQADPLRMHVAHAGRLQALLRVAGLPLDSRVRPHIARTAGLLAALRAIKAPHDPEACAPAEALQLRAAALTRRAVLLDRGQMSAAVRARERPPPLVLLDGAAMPAQEAAVRATLPAALRRLPAAEVAGLAALVAPGLAAADIALPWDWVAPPTRPAAPDWPWWTALPPGKAERLAALSVPVCAATCRPFSRVPAAAAAAAVSGAAAMGAAAEGGGAEAEAEKEEAVSWRVASEAAFGPLAQQLCTRRMYGAFVAKHGAYPTLAELGAFVWARTVVPHKRQQGGGRAVAALPCTLEAMLAVELADHAPLAATLPAAEFARRWLASAQMEARQRIEDAAGPR